jgi:hypothetical protein
MFADVNKFVKSCKSCKLFAKLKKDLKIHHTVLESPFVNWEL